MKRFALVLALLLLTGAGCAPAGEEEVSGPVVWFAGDTSQWSPSASALGSRP